MDGERGQRAPRPCRSWSLSSARGRGQGMRGLGHRVPVVILSCVGIPGWGLGCSAEPGAGGAARSGAGAWEGGMLQGTLHAQVWHLSCPGGSRGRRGAPCVGLSRLPQVFQPEGSGSTARGHIQQQPRALGWLCRCLGWSPGATSSPSLCTLLPSHGISAKPWLCHPKSCSSCPPQGVGEAAWHAHILGDAGEGPAFLTVGKAVMVWRRCRCVEPPFSRGPRRQVRGQLTHLCCHGEFSPRHRETVAFPQNLTGSVWMLGFSWK